ncbi:hypothetical protein ACLOJK_000879 [Asimina triloba]
MSVIHIRISGYADGGRITEGESSSRTESRRLPIALSPIWRRSLEMLETPPPFQEADRCDVCKCGFSTFRRRAFRRLLCKFGLPYGFWDPSSQWTHCHILQRSQAVKSVVSDPQPYSDGIATTADQFSKLDVSKDVDTVEPRLASVSTSLNIPECKCGMPLCICQAPAPTPDPAPLKMHNATASTVHSNPRPKKAMNAKPNMQDSTSKHIGSTSNSKQRLHSLIILKLLFSSWIMGQIQTARMHKVIPADASIAKACSGKGHPPISWNLIGETPLDCAPTMLQYKLRKRMEEGAQL